MRRRNFISRGNGNARVRLFVICNHSSLCSPEAAHFLEMRGSPLQFNIVDGNNNRIIIYRKEGVLHSLKFVKMEVWKQTQGKLVYMSMYYLL
jgi:hypothetical protein